MPHCGIFRHHFVEVLGIEGIDEINLAAHQAEHLDITVLLNIEADGINVG